MIFWRSTYPYFTKATLSLSPTFTTTKSSPKPPPRSLLFLEKISKVQTTSTGSKGSLNSMARTVHLEFSCIPYHVPLYQNTPTSCIMHCPPIPRTLLRTFTGTAPSTVTEVAPRPKVSNLINIIPQLFMILLSVFFPPISNAYHLSIGI